MKPLQDRIHKNARTLYSHKLKYGDSTRLAKRCNDFAALERLCDAYGKWPCGGLPTAHSSIVYTNAPIRRPEALATHLCTLSRPRGVARDTTVYTNAPNRRGEARSSHLCTLLWSSRVPTVQQCTQTPQTGAESPDHPICVHYRGHAGLPATQQCTQTPQIDRREALATHLCTLLRPPGATHSPTVYTNAPKIQQKSHREFGTSSHLSCPSKNAAILSNGMASFPPPS